MNKDSIQWEAYEHEHREKSADWFWVIGIVSVTIAVIAIILSNILFSVLVLIAAFTLMLHADKHPRLINFEVRRQGVVIDTLLFPYSTLEYFWVEENEEPVKLLLKSQKLFVPLLVLPLDPDVNPDQIRDIISKELLEKELKEPLAQRLLERVGLL